MAVLLGEGLFAEKKKSECNRPQRTHSEPADALGVIAEAPAFPVWSAAVDVHLVSCPLGLSHARSRGQARRVALVASKSSLGSPFPVPTSVALLAATENVSWCL